MLIRYAWRNNLTENVTTADFAMQFSHTLDLLNFQTDMRFWDGRGRIAVLNEKKKYISNHLFLEIYNIVFGFINIFGNNF